MRKEYFINPAVTVKGEIVLEKRENDYYLKVGTEGGSVYIHGDAGNVGGVKWTSDKFITFPIK